MADASDKSSREYLLNRIKEQEKLMADYQKRLKENPGDAETAVTVMTLQVALEELKLGL